MMKHMFLDICHAVSAKNDYFKRKCNAAGLPGFTTVQKVTAALRILAYGGAADRLDEYFHMGESTILESVREFTSTMIDIYGDWYLRQPNAQDVAKLLAKAEERGFPGMLGSIDCMHWEWEKCPTRLHGQYRGHHKKPTIILEAVASHNLHIWHAFFGMPGSLNDINVRHRSHVFDSISSGTCAPVNFNVNGTDYNMGYLLANGIYPPWRTLVKGLRCPQTMKETYFTSKQSAHRKDVERAFGVLQAKYQIVKGPARTWKPSELKKIMECVVIMHNMGIEYEEGLEELRAEDYEDATPARLNPNRNVPEIHRLIAGHRQIESRSGHDQLTADLMEHVWSTYGSR